MSIREANSAERELARRNKDTVDQAVAALLVLLMLLRRDLQRTTSESQTAVRIAVFNAGLDSFVTHKTEAINAEMLAALGILYGMGGVQDEIFVDISKIGKTLADKIQQQLLTSADEARLLAWQTGQPYTDILADLIGAPGFLSSTRRGADTAFTMIAQGSLYSAGLGQARRKVAIPVVDSHTTPLCRGRMAYQVRAWEDYFEDPASGARWLFPPFIYGGLSAREAFHFCRTTIAPVI